MVTYLEYEVVQGVHYDTSGLFHNRHSRVQHDLKHMVQSVERVDR